MAIVVFQHSSLDTPGRLGMTLRDHGHRLDIRRMDMGGKVPPDLDDVEGVISLGGPQNVDVPHTDWPWMDDEMAFLKAAFEADLPIVGICLGAQMLAAALGGEVQPMREPQMGFRTMTLTPAAHSDDLLAGHPWDSPQFFSHTREVTTLPPGGVSLASTDRCKHVIYRVGMRAIAFQHHPEVDRDGVATYARENKRAFYDAGLTYDEVMKQAEKHYPMFARTGDRVFVNLATYLLRPLTSVGDRRWGTTRAKA